MEKVPEIRNSGTISGTIFVRKPEISGTLFWNYGTLQNCVPENSGLRNNCSGIFRKKVLENVEYILNWKFYGLCNVNRKKISGLRNGNWKFYGLRDVNRKNFRFTKWKLEILRFPFRKLEKFTVYVT